MGARAQSREPRIRPGSDTVVVTGASSGIGRACVRAAIARGFRVVATVRTEPDAEALCNAVPGPLRTVVLDVTDPDAPAAARSAVEAADGARLHGLVNSAGIAVQGPLDCLSRWTGGGSST